MPSQFTKLRDFVARVVEYHNGDPLHLGEAFGHILSPFGDMRSVERTPVIELKSIYGASELRDLITTTAGGSVTNDPGITGEYILTTSATANSAVILDSAERGRYVPGYGAEAGLGVRLVTTPTGSQVYRWGYFDENDGFFFGYDANGLFVGKRNNGVETTVRSADFNENKFDGNGLYGKKIDVFSGEIFQIDFSWYGDGAANFKVVSGDDNGRQYPFTAHRQVRDQQTTIRIPNLPIRAEVDNSATGSALEMHVAGRQFSIIGKYQPNRRVTSQHSFSATISGTDLTPLIAFQRKTAYDSASIKVDGFEIITDNDLHVVVSTVDNFDSATFGTPIHTLATETAVEVATDASSASNSIAITSSLVEAGGTGSNTVGSQDREGLNADVPRNKAVVLQARSIDGNQAIVSSIFRVREEW